MRFTLDCIVKVGFGVELNCLEGFDGENLELMKAIDESNSLMFWRNADPIWKLKRSLNIGSEATLKKYVKIVKKFVTQVIETRKQYLATAQDNVS